MLSRIYQCFLFALLLVAIASVDQVLAAESWQAGSAKVAITPAQPMWMSGYAGRNKPAEGKLHDLWAKALVLQNPEGQQVVMVTLDLVGIGRALSVEICDRLASKYGLTRAQVALCCSHTHTGPVVGRNLMSMYFLEPEQEKLIVDYTDVLADKVVQVVGQALKNVAPATIAWETGKATFAVNRRENKESEVPKLREAGQLKGPIDHDVPVLAVRDQKGKLRSILCGYACHATVLSFYQWTGDWPGFAQIELEDAHPDCVALFFAGCGADQNPLPRRTVELAENYGRQLATAVDEVLAEKMQPITGKLLVSYEEIDLPFESIPTVEQLKADTASSNRYVKSRAELLLEQVESGQPISAVYPYPVQLWKLGDGPLLVLLGGEVVVDFSIRIKRELGRDTTWVAGYSNDVMAYIPSRRVWDEGGYEGGGAMLYYGLPNRWASDVEIRVLEEVHRQQKKLLAAE